MQKNQPKLLVLVKTMYLLFYKIEYFCLDFIY